MWTPIKYHTTDRQFSQKLEATETKKRHNQSNQSIKTKKKSKKKKGKEKTHGFRFVGPPVGPAVPLSLTVYVEPRVPRTWSARPATMAGVGPP